MSEKKNIERLFQEKFKDFEARPEPKVWDKIETELQKKQKRRVIPLWIRLSGVAAILLLSFLIGNDWQNNIPNDNTNSIVNESNANSENEPDLIPGKNDFQTQEMITDSNSENDRISSESSSQEKNSFSASENDLKNEAVAEQETQKKKEKNKLNPAISIPNKSNPTAIHDNNAIVNQNNKNAGNPNKDKGSINNKGFDIKESLANQNVPHTVETPKVPEITETERLKSIPNSRIALHTEAFANQKKDSAVVAAAEPNALEELLKEKERKDQTVTEAKLNRWQITSNVAPIYFSSASNGSPIDEQFADNSKEYEKNLSYGVGVNYTLNKKWTVRGGVNKLTLGYNTNDIAYYASLTPMARGVSSANFESRGTTIIVEDYSAQNLISLSDNIPDKKAGHLNQTMGFIEVPMEISYKLIDKKFGVEVIGGMSTLFLNENSLSVVSDGMSASLGKASNLNDVSFSSNIGIGFKYRFWKSFQANVEPKLKYQFNTFSDNPGNFKPYFIGLYSGVSFSF